VTGVNEEEVLELLISEIPDRMPIRREIGGLRGVLIVRIGDEIYAADDECPHEGCFLSDGYLDAEDKTITCTCHWSTFRLSDGVSLTPDVTTNPMKLYKVERRGERVVILISSPFQRLASRFSRQLNPGSYKAI
jgi:3-phenylpropionate/trans-cinnamate dioxygenase ferredoxin subunit